MLLLVLVFCTGEDGPSSFAVPASLFFADSCMSSSVLPLFFILSRVEVAFIEAFALNLLDDGAGDGEEEDDVICSMRELNLLLSSVAPLPLILPLLEPLVDGLVVTGIGLGVATFSTAIASTVEVSIRKLTAFTGDWLLELALELFLVDFRIGLPSLLRLLGDDCLLSSKSNRMARPDESAILALRICSAACCNCDSLPRALSLVPGLS